MEWFDGDSRQTDIKHKMKVSGLNDIFCDYRTEAESFSKTTQKNKVLKDRIESFSFYIFHHYYFSFVHGGACS